MTKSERLLCLIKLMREGKGIRLKALSESCQVSQRTIYRDLISLSRVNVPVRLEKSGYKISRENSSLAMLVDFPDDRDLIRLILRATELTHQSLFAARIASLDARLASLERKAVTGRNRTKIRFSGPFQPIPLPDLTNLVVPFCSAIKEGQQVRLAHAGPEKVTIADPRGVVFEGGQILFLYRWRGKKEIARVASSDLVAISAIQRKRPSGRPKTG